MAIQSNFPNLKPSLLLDFANTKALDPRITFTRSTTATFYDGVTTAKAEENLFINSQNSTTGWTNLSNRLTITTSYEPAPDGTTTGMRLLNSSGVQGFFYQNVGNNSLVSGTTYALSVWVKSNTGASQTISLMMPETGTTTNVTATTTWSRVSWVSTLASTNSFAGLILNNGADISVWGFQLEQRSSVTAYTATTSQPITNYIPVLQTAASGVPRFDHNPTTDESLGLLIEEQRTNLLTYSADFSNAAWTKTRSSITADTIVAPDGTLTGDKLVENTDTDSHFVGRSSISVTENTTYTATAFLKAGERTWATLYNGLSNTWFNLSNGTIGNVASNRSTSASITSVGNGWYRCSITFTIPTGVTTYIYAVSTATGNGVETYTGNGFNGIYIWGAQLEAGAFATSYIPTVASTVTRNADAASMTGTNFSSWYSAAEGTVYTEFVTAASSTNLNVVQLGSTASNGVSLHRDAGAANWRYRTGLSNLNLTNAQFTSGSNKVAFCYAASNYPISINGNSVSLNLGVGAVAAADQLLIGAGTLYATASPLNGTIKKIAYYPLRVTNAQLQALTS